MISRLQCTRETSDISDAADHPSSGGSCSTRCSAEQQEQPEQAVPIGQRNLPRNISTTRSAIFPPPCLRQNFEMKPALIGLVQRKVFSGLSTEIPMEHIESFQKFCSFTRANGLPLDYIKCMLFQFSLDGKAARWLNSLPTGSLPQPFLL